MSVKITVRTDINLGMWQGIGGAITEATAYNFAKLSPHKQQQFLDAYYGKNGLDYRWGRISIGSNDFCLQPYEYTKRTDLRDFSIIHDKRWLLPLLQRIVAQKKLQLIACPWSPPKCLKIGNLGQRGGILKPWHYQTYVAYIQRWLSAYAKAGIAVRYLTPQNEPRAFQIWESCWYSYRAQRKLAYQYLAPALRDTDVCLLLWDHNKKHLAKIADKLFAGSHVTEYGADSVVAGLCYHWYNGTHPDQMWQVRQKYPDIMLLSSEMCCGFSAPYDEQDWQGAAMLYYRELFADINCGATAWVDWNMLLDWQGGPSYCNNYVKSPIILNEAGNDIVLTPIYQALKAFVKLFPAGSKIIRCDYKSTDLVAIARKNQRGYTVVLANLSNEAQEATVKLGAKTIKCKLSAHELHSLTF